MSRAPTVKLRPPPAWSRELTTVGVTGTNGKTSTTALTAAALGAVWAPVARVTTVGNYVGDERLVAGADREGFLATMRAALDRGGRHAVIELTSEALALGFAKYWPCRQGVFTNLTRDHLDAHGSAEHYLASKAQLFMTLPEGGTAVLNGCDPASALLAEVIPAGVSKVHYGVASRGEPVCALDLAARRVDLGWGGTRIAIDPTAPLAGGVCEIAVQAIGEVYAENALAAFAVARAMGVDAALVARALATVPTVTGRFERVAEAPAVVVDYAHTPDALARTLGTARALCPGRLVLVFGAGGGRDRDKRPQMGAASALADRVVLTSDNPRDEDPAAIAAAVRAGIPGGVDVTRELDRARAIRLAVAEASEDDLVLVTGKGHETEQLARGERRHFSDSEAARAAHRERPARRG